VILRVPRQWYDQSAISSLVFLFVTSLMLTIVQFYSSYRAQFIQRVIRQMLDLLSMTTAGLAKHIQGCGKTRPHLSSARYSPMVRRVLVNNVPTAMYQLLIVLPWLLPMYSTRHILRLICKRTLFLSTHHATQTLGPTTSSLPGEVRTDWSHEHDWSTVSLLIAAVHKP